MSMTTLELQANRRNQLTRWLAIVGLASVLAGGCSNGKAKEKEDAADKASAVPVETQPLKRAEMLAIHSGTAPIEAQEEAEVVAKVGGEVRQIFVEEGDTVQSGQVLARLDGDRLRLDAIMRELALASSGRTDSTTAPRVGRLVQARRVVYGALDAQATNMGISVGVADAATRQVQPALSQQTRLDNVLRRLVFVPAAAGSAIGTVTFTEYDGDVQVVLPPSDQVIVLADAFGA